MKIFLPCQLLLLVQDNQASPLYQRLWPQILLLVAVAVLFFLLYLMKNKHLRKKFRKLITERQNLSEKLENSEKKSKDLEVLVQEKNLEVEKANQELDKLARIDSITGVASFNRFLEFFKQEWRRSGRYSRPLSLVIIEVDFREEFLETYGREIFNKSLRQVAQMLTEIIRRPGDIVARYQDRDFVLVLSETESNNVVDLAEMIRVGAEFLKIETSVSIISKFATISLGCATTHPKPDSDPAPLIKAAETALSQAKDEGGNRVHAIKPL